MRQWTGIRRQKKLPALRAAGWESGLLRRLLPRFRRDGSVIARAERTDEGEASRPRPTEEMATPLVIARNEAIQPGVLLVLTFQKMLPSSSKARAKPAAIQLDFLLASACQETGNDRGQKSYRRLRRRLGIRIGFVASRLAFDEMGARQVAPRFGEAGARTWQWTF
jgi:hypothetical protein